MKKTYKITALILVICMIFCAAAFGASASLPIPNEWDVCDRDLAMFALLVARDGTDVVGSMYQQEEYNPETDRKPFFGYADLAEFERWTLVDDTAEWSDIFKSAEFRAQTFKIDNSVVIAIRGTDGEIGEWVYNIASFIINVHIEEKNARAYALKIADEYPDCKIYITGHSLGGYLAYFAAAELLEKRPDAKLERVVPFNAMGMDFIPLLSFKNAKTLSLLDEFSESGTNGKLVYYHINGDFGSGMGFHPGEGVFFDIAENVRNEVLGRSAPSALEEFFWGKLAVPVMNLVVADDFAGYYQQYGAKTVPDFLSASHDMCNFLCHLTRGTSGAK
ncbi:MAG: DUF2974 domain-containing protein [Oscillospiraceae bacterium]|nr:DUF2974 domain-containing protein [Oscillospiraceae bacterium]